MTKKIKLITDAETGKVRFVRIDTPRTYYYVSPEFVMMKAKEKFMPSEFIEAKKRLERIQK